MQDKDQDDKVKRFRSPQFPFIPLDKAVARAREFDAEYHQNAARASSVVKTWGYAPKSSGGIQTVAALTAFGLMDDEGSRENRKLKLTPLALTILKDTRAGAAAAALKTAALKPKVLADLWSAWGAHRPPEHDCISTLHLDKKFSEQSAVRLLDVYDATIRHAELAPSDKIDDNANRAEDQDSGKGKDKLASVDKLPPLVQPPPPVIGEVPLMPNERIVYTHDQGPDKGFRILATGEFDAEMVAVLQAFAEFQAKVVPKKTVAAQGGEDGAPEK